MAGDPFVDTVATIAASNPETGPIFRAGVAIKDVYDASTGIYSEGTRIANQCVSDWRTFDRYETAFGNAIARIGMRAFPMK